MKTKPILKLLHLERKKGLKRYNVCMQQQIWAGKSPCFAGMMSSKLVMQRSA